MEASLTLEGTLEHDGDGCCRFQISLINEDFSATTSVWGNNDTHLEFAAALSGFPSSASSTLSYRFGSPGTGTCALDFSCLDSLGHISIWATFESTYPASRSSRHEQASLFMLCEPNAIDAFVAAIKDFVADTRNRAVLSGLGP
jgi:hypothetical protein